MFSKISCHVCLQDTLMDLLLPERMRRNATGAGRSSEPQLPKETILLLTYLATYACRTP
jgi:hypothetical protein